jgi:hypothetical protein
MVAHVSVKCAMMLIGAVVESEVSTLMFLESLNAFARRVLFLAAVVFGIASACLGQVRVSHESTVSTFDGRYVTVTYLEGEPNGRKGSMRAPIEGIDLVKADVSSPYDGTWWIVLQCRDKFGTTCFTDLNTGAELAWFSYPYVSCSSRSECDSFLKALKDAATGSTRQSSGRPAESSQIKSAEDASTYGPSGRSARSTKDKPADEPVIDGSKIPSQINFNKPGATNKKTDAPESPKPTVEPLSSYLGSDNPGAKKASANDTEKFGSLFDSGAAQGQTSASGPAEARRRAVEINSAEVEKYGAGLFDEARKGRLQTVGDPLRYAAREYFTEQYKRLAENETSYVFTGKAFDELPEEFRKDYAVWDTSLKRLHPFSAKRGLQQVDALGSLLDLWDKP